jgi:hypothetical protein
MAGMPFRPMTVASAVITIGPLLPLFAAIALHERTALLVFGRLRSRLQPLEGLRACHEVGRNGVNPLLLPVGTKVSRMFPRTSWRP